MPDFKVGRVTHYYNKLEVAIIELSTALAKGDRIKFTRGGEDLFEQVVDSMQVEHEFKDTAEKGDVVGIKTREIVKEGADVYKITP